MRLASPALQAWWLVFVSDAVAIPPPPPLWMTGGLVLALIAAVYHVVQQLLRTRRPRSPWVISTVALCASLAWVGRYDASAAPPEPPSVRLAHALKLAAQRLRREVQRSGRCPSSWPEKEGLLRTSDGKTVPSGLYGHGSTLPVRVVDRPDASGPVLRARTGDPPGILYYATSPAGKRCWLTALTLEGHPRGTLRFLRQPDGQPAVERIEAPASPE